MRCFFHKVKIDSEKVIMIPSKMCLIIPSEMVQSVKIIIYVYVLTTGIRMGHEILLTIRVPYNDCIPNFYS